MLRFAFIGLAVLGFTMTAKGDIQGKWKLTSFGCSSGATYGGKMYDMKVDGGMTIDDKQMTSQVALQLKFRPGVGEQLLSDAKDAIADVKKEADGPDKEQALAELDKALKLIEQIVAGLSCTIEETRPYEVTDRGILEKAATRVESSCPQQPNGGSASEEPALFDVSGDTLTIRRVMSVGDDSCPNGDREMMTLERVR